MGIYVSRIDRDDISVVESNFTGEFDDVPWDTTVFRGNGFNICPGIVVVLL